MMICKHCRNRCIKTSKILKCSYCDKKVHTVGCSGLGSEQLSILKDAEEGLWMCKPCKDSLQTRITMMSTNLNRDELKTFLTESLHMKIKMFQKNLVPLKSKLDYYCEKFDKLRLGLDPESPKDKKAIRKYTYLKNEMAILDARLQNLIAKSNEIHSQA